jgi:hypothetical protein
MIGLRLKTHPWFSLCGGILLYLAVVRIPANVNTDSGSS